MLEPFFEEKKARSVNATPVDFFRFDLLIDLVFGAAQKLCQQFLPGFLCRVVRGQSLKTMTVAVRMLLVMAKEPAFASGFGDHRDAALIVSLFETFFDTADELFVILIGGQDLGTRIIAVVEEHRSCFSSA